MVRRPFRALAALMALTSNIMLWASLARGIQASSVTSMLKWRPSLTSRQSPTTACNNSPLLCDRAYSNITHMGAHNSAFVRDASTGNSISGNQYYNATVALSAGIRLLQAQVHVQDGALRLCHTVCALLDAGPLDAWLAKIADWLAGHPDEVVTLLLVNSDGADADSFGAAFERSGIARYAFAPPPDAAAPIAWPTLRELIAANTRLVTFVASIDRSPAHPYLLSEFAHVFETPFNTTSLSGFTCALDRPAPSSSGYPSAGAAIGAGLLALLNHFAYTAVTPDVLIPAASEVDTTNGASTTQVGALGRHADRCTAEWGGVRPVFALVDFFDRGPAMDTADRLNGVVGTVVGREVPGGEGKGKGKGNGGGGGESIAAASDGIGPGGKVLALAGFLGWALLAGF
ncbi:hypothetical protein VTK26DRAFT_4844 [Humicola hyalothermophila]